MGSFSFTCCVSGLPIEAGDPVRYFLVAQNPYGDEGHKCYIHDLWHPRTWPLRAKYDEYGSVEGVEEGPHKQSWLDSLKLDLAPVGWGENSCHSTSTSRDMTFERLLEAVWEGRVKIRGEVSTWVLEPEIEKRLGEFRSAKEKQKIPVGVPTRKRLEKLLTENGIPVFNGAHEKGSMIVGRQGYGRYRLRHGDYGEDGESLARAEAVLKKAGYATMITKGAGSYSFSGELLVRPLPTVKDYHFFSREGRPPLQVRQAMVREDVWQALASLDVPDAWGGSTYNRAKARAGAEKAWRGVAKKRDSEQFVDLDFLNLKDGRDTHAFVKDAIPFTIGLGTMFRLMGKKHQAGEVSEEQVQAFLDTTADFTVLHALLSLTRYQWRPSYSNGPQFGEWELHKTVTDALAKVTSAKAEEARLEREAYERESAEFEKQLKAKKARKKAAKKK